MLESFAESIPWIFSGVGVALLAGILGLFFRRRSPPETPTGSVSANSSNVLQAGRDIHVSSNSASTSSDSSIDSVTERKILALDLGENVFFFGILENFPQIRSIVPNGLFEVSNSISRSAKDLGMQPYSGHSFDEMEAYYRESLSSTLRAYFLIGFKVGHVHNAFGLASGQQTKEAIVHYQQALDRLRLALEEFDLTDCISYLPQGDTEGLAQVKEDPFPGFSAKLRRSIRSK